MPHEVPPGRIRALNDAPPRSGGGFVLYWMIAARRTGWSFGLQRAVELARELRRPLLVLEALRAGHPWAAERFHRFVLDGMADNARRFDKAGVTYHAYVEPEAGAGRGLLAALGGRACAVVTDDFPAFFLPRMVRAAADRVPVRLEAVDSNGLLPLRATDRVFATAHSFRSFVQRQLAGHLDALPAADPLAGGLPGRAEIPRNVLQRWPAVEGRLLDGTGSLAALPIDHAVAAGPLRGGREAARRVLQEFLDERLERYVEDRNHPDLDATSGLSPYLHFGHIAAHEVFAALMTREAWHEGKLGRSTRGAREGWWGVSPPAEAFLDQLVTWRELGFQHCARDAFADRWPSLPTWARATLEKHAGDPRPRVYDLATLEGGRTHDALWNAAQTQLVREGRMHNDLRMLWGKKILEWSPSPEVALDRMLRLNDRRALDGRDPNSISGIGWVLGRYDRPWGPERPVFGTVRFMSSTNTARRVRVKDYLRRYAP